MKRILCATLTVLLTLAFCASAHAAAYTHPTGGYHLTVPEGWIAIDGVNLEEMINSGRLNPVMSATVTAIRGMLEDTANAYLFKEDVTEPPFVNISVEYKGDQGDDISLDELLEYIQLYEAYFQTEKDQFPGYTVTTPAGASLIDDWYPIGYLSGAYDKSGFQIGIMHIVVAAGSRMFEFTLTGEEDQVNDVSDVFFEFVESLDLAPAA